VGVDGLLEQFLLSNEGLAGKGPEHPTTPAQGLAPVVGRWLAVHPFLRNAADYVAFLGRYAGAELTDRAARIGIVIHGFTGIGGDLGEVEPNVYDYDNPCVCPDGFYQFALVEESNAEVRGETIYRSFGFDGTGRREWGVYLSVYVSVYVGGEPSVVGRWFCRSFSEWLALAYEGRVDVADDPGGRVIGTVTEPVSFPARLL